MPAPEEPEQPEEPEEPDESDEPEQSDEPEEPEQSDEPDESEEPDEPEEPEQSDEPDEPEESEEPDESEEPVELLGDCTTDLRTLRSGAVRRTGAWSSDCRTLLRGDAQTRYYARQYTFTLDTEATVTATVKSPQATYVYLLEYPYTNETEPHDSGATQAEESLDEGTHAIVVVRNASGEHDGSFTLTVSADTAAAAQCLEDETRLWGGSCAPAGQDVYEFTEGTLAATLKVATDALADPPERLRSCVSQRVPVPDNKLSPHKLAALMLSIPVHELTKHSPSPMFLVNRPGIPGGS